MNLLILNNLNLKLGNQFLKNLLALLNHADTIRKLAGEANNINQLAHRSNAGGFALVAVELVKLKNRIIEIINHLSDDWKNKKGKRV